MTTKLDPAEVLSYLNELGYHNITAIQLKEFMKGMYVIQIMFNHNLILMYLPFRSQKTNKI